MGVLIWQQDIGAGNARRHIAGSVAAEAVEGAVALKASVKAMPWL